jgi:hypothetical protein
MRHAAPLHDKSGQADSSPANVNMLRLLENCCTQFFPSKSSGSGMVEKVQFIPSESQIELEYPARLVPYPAWVGHIPFALWITAAHKPRIFVELGVHTGNSYCAFLQAVKALSLQTKCFGVDHWKGDQHSGSYGQEVYEELKAYHDPRYGDFSTLVLSSFEDALKRFSDESVDLLHIDGLHTYEAIAQDFANWLPKMSSRGIVLFHDINARDTFIGAWQFWQATAPRFPSFDFIHSHGLGVLYVGKDPLSGALSQLFNSDGQSNRSKIRTYFARLGSSIVDRYMLDQEREAMIRLKRETEQHIRAIDAPRFREIAEKEQRILAIEAQRSKEFADLEARLAMTTQLLNRQTIHIIHLQREFAIFPQRPSIGAEIASRIPLSVKKMFPIAVRKFVKQKLLGLPAS